MLCCGALGLAADLLVQTLHTLLSERSEPVSRWVSWMMIIIILIIIMQMASTTTTTATTTAATLVGATTTRVAANYIEEVDEPTNSFLVRDLCWTERTNTKSPEKGNAEKRANE